MCPGYVSTRARACVRGCCGLRVVRRSNFTGVPGKIYEFSEINLDLTVESDAKCVHWVAQPIPHVLTERYFA